jgi:hypothetical protein
VKSPCALKLVKREGALALDGSPDHSSTVPEPLPVSGSEPSARRGPIRRFCGGVMPPFAPGPLAIG